MERRSIRDIKSHSCLAVDTMVRNMVIVNLVTIKDDKLSEVMVLTTRFSDESRLHYMLFRRRGKEVVVLYYCIRHFCFFSIFV